MPRIKTIAAGILLGAGLFVSILTTSTLLDPKTSPDARSYFATGFVVFGITPLAYGSWLVLKNNQQDQQKERGAFGSRERVRLQGIFYKLLKEGNGQINVLRFSMEANINGTDAKAFLDKRAREFNASFDVSEEGKISYYFDGDFQTLPQTTEFDLILESYPWRNRETILNHIQNQLNLERRLVKMMLKQGRSYPVTIAKGISQSRADALRNHLEGAGAKVEPNFCDSSDVGANCQKISRTELANSIQARLHKQR